MKKILPKTTHMMACLVLILSFMLTGCGSTKLAEGFDEAVVTETAKEVVGLMNDEDYQAICDMFSDDLKDALTPEKLEESLGQIVTDRGDFKEIQNVAVVGQKIKDTEEDAAVAVVVASYENNKNTYTISFNKDMKLIGFFMK